MKKNIKRFLPKFVKKSIINFIENQTITNYCKTDFSKNALVSHMTIPFIKNSMSHTNFFEAQSLVKILFELNYNVDIIHYDNSKSVDLSKYDLILGFGDIFRKYFEYPYMYKAKTIHYATGMHVCHQNQATLKRVKDVYEKKGIWLAKSARFVEKTWSHQTVLVDAIIALGNDVCANSYKKYYDGKVYSVAVPFYKTKEGEKIVMQRGKDASRNFLWFGSSGLVHKGLDLLLEYFSKNSDLTLHICAALENEPEFVNAYKNELHNSKNIITHGFVDIKDKLFEDILKSCSFVIFPSCSEGGAASVITAIGNGGLIPIITRETAISSGYEVWIDSFDYSGVDKAIKEAVALSDEEILYLQSKNLEYVLNNHSQKNYYNMLKESIAECMDV
ncbi:MAG: hypothetical protein A2513_03300 [Sulfurimonas sp. RIFOXYD12_FULL_33_39]|uniref:glycosyltransferase n=1 Tax=unclassified Sulfurimonas TaxID=2623549 RepID=UPI0008CC2D6E|nr:MULTISPECIES: glycosyltransferase [unclassified Sulfurimonas]OHE06486.1 MAG: hypothetical protein A3G74_02415 [Sulfurimonas sp. RIFCSPLOWO2_12_FULL_34_6]OHE09017.1 MAG: hypothetical protein A2513_03300 [Sulfurimonas sp. RIFOXYD12_FULL_33_39]OHE14327.1 MAG: hypothetical protein A2530_06600 [Sulfurimonas sp. RIFOXYD2_FULL_34_21]DAB27286.1 MAG TPA: hypothetical protein CFH78_08685 [Sulfurimonas sp. UBA10385]